jgi:predicted DNA-binding transcriptional regulator AlpA
VDRLLSMNETASQCGLSVRQIYKLVANGRFGPEVILSPITSNCASNDRIKLGH